MGEAKKTQKMGIVQGKYDRSDEIDIEHVFAISLSLLIGSACPPDKRHSFTRGEVIIYLACKKMFFFSENNRLKYV